MAYGLKYFTEYKDTKDVLHRVELLFKDFEGDSVEVTPSPNPFTPRKNKVAQNHSLGGLVVTKYTIEAVSQDGFTALDFANEDFDFCVVAKYKAGNLESYSFVNPSECRDSYQPNGSYYVSISSECGLTFLKGVQYYDTANGNFFTGRSKLIDIIFNCLEKIPYPSFFGIKTINNTKVYTGTTSSPTQVNVDKDFYQITTDNEVFQKNLFNYDSCYNVLSEIITENCELFFENGFWYIRNIPEISSLQDTYISTYSANRTFVNRVLYDRSYKYFESDLFSKVGSNQLLSNSIKNIQITKKSGFLKNYLPNPDFKASGSNVLNWTNINSIGASEIGGTGIESNPNYFRISGSVHTQSFEGVDSEYLQSSVVNYKPFISPSNDAEQLTITGKAELGTGIKALRLQIVALQTYSPSDIPFYLKSDGTWSQTAEIYTIGITKNKRQGDFTIKVPSPPFYDNGIGLPDFSAVHNYKFQIRLFRGERDNITIDSAIKSYFVKYFNININKTPLIAFERIEGKTENYFVDKKTDRTNNVAFEYKLGHEFYDYAFGAFYETTSSTSPIFGFGQFQEIIIVPYDYAFFVSKGYLSCVSNRLEIFDGSVLGDVAFNNILYIGSKFFRIENFDRNTRHNETRIKCIELKQNDNFVYTESLEIIRDSLVSPIVENNDNSVNSDIAVVGGNFLRTIPESGGLEITMNPKLRLNAVNSEEGVDFINIGNETEIVNIGKQDSITNHKGENRFYNPDDTFYSKIDTSEITANSVGKLPNLAEYTFATDLTAWMIGGNNTAQASLLGSLNAIDTSFIWDGEVVTTVKSNTLHFPLLPTLGTTPTDIMVNDGGLLKKRSLSNIKTDLLTDIGNETYWKIDGNNTTSKRFIGSLSNFDVGFIRNGSEVAHFGSGYFRTLNDIRVNQGSKLGFVYNNDNDANTYHYMTGGGANPLSFYNIYTGGNAKLFSFNNSANEILSIYGGGLVGVNQPNPSSAIHVKGVSAKTATLQSYTTAGNNYLQFDTSAGDLQSYIGHGSSDNRFIFYLASNDYYFYAGGASRLTIKENGNVGIGTDSPSFKTDINGTLRATGFNLPTGANANYILQSDSSGNASWINPSALSNIYKGTWDASTNTPTLANGTGTTGNWYRCVVAGTVNFGAGNITFAVGDDVSYNGTVWQRIPFAFTLQTASSSVLGGIRIGSTLAIDGSGIANLNTITQSTGSSFVKIALNSYGQVTGNSNVTLSDLTTLGAFASSAFDSTFDTRWNIKIAGYVGFGGAVSVTGEFVAEAGLSIYGKLYDAGLSEGTNGQFLKSTGTGTDWTTLGISNISGLQTALDGKSATGHTHSWTDITDKPSTFTPSTHNHTVSEITDFVTGFTTQYNAKITGTENYLPKFGASNVLGNSQFFDNGTNVGVGTNTLTSGFKMTVSGGVITTNLTASNTTKSVSLTVNPNSTNPRLATTSILDIYSTGETIFYGSGIDPIGTIRARLNNTGLWLGSETTAISNRLHVTGNINLTGVIKTNGTSPSAGWHIKATSSSAMAWSDLNADVIGSALNGFTDGDNTTITATDTILQAFQKLESDLTNFVKLSDFAGERGFELYSDAEKTRNEGLIFVNPDTGVLGFHGYVLQDDNSTIKEFGLQLDKDGNLYHLQLDGTRKRILTEADALTGGNTWNGGIVSGDIQWQGGHRQYWGTYRGVNDADVRMYYNTDANFKGLYIQAAYGNRLALSSDTDLYLTTQTTGTITINGITSTFRLPSGLVNGDMVGMQFQNGNINFIKL
jgi:Phage tail repeat like